VTVIGPLKLVGRNVPERRQQAARVVPRDPLQRRELDVLDAFPRPAAINLFGLVEADDPPVLPTDGSIPTSARRSVYRIDRYWTPRSL
jgi:hypothetical protein